MVFPTDVPVIDTFMGVRPLPGGDSPIGHLFGQTSFGGDEGAELLLPHMDRFGIERALIDLAPGDEPALDAYRRHPDRFIASHHADPHLGMAGVRDIRHAYEVHGIAAVTATPAFYRPAVPIDDARFYPIYAACADLGLPIFLTAGVPGPRVPFDAQDPRRLDPVCAHFPELTIVTRHGCLPWADLAVALMLKWPNLFYSTSAMAPRHYPREVVDFLNSRGRDRVLFAGYFPIGLTIERVMSELLDLPVRDAAWAPFLHGNARRILRLD